MSVLQDFDNKHFDNKHFDNKHFDNVRETEDSALFTRIWIPGHHDGTVHVVG